MTDQEKATFIRLLLLDIQENLQENERAYALNDRLDAQDKAYYQNAYKAIAKANVGLIDLVYVLEGGN